MLETVRGSGGRAGNTRIPGGFLNWNRCGTAREISALVLLFLIMLAARPFDARAEPMDGSMICEGSGIMFPGGFDVNTVGEVKGTVISLSAPESGPASLELRSERETYVIYLSPKWYWEKTGTDVKTGDKVTATGSKSLGRDGTLYLVAETITLDSAGKTINLRTATGRPLWMMRMGMGDDGGSSRGRGQDGQGRMRRGYGGGR